MHEGYAEPTARKAERHRSIISETKLFGGLRQFLQLRGNGSNLPLRPLGPECRDGLLDSGAISLVSDSGGLENAFQKGQVARLGYIRAEQVVFRIFERGANGANLAALA